jgi:hypothetical protein
MAWDGAVASPEAVAANQALREQYRTAPASLAPELRARAELLLARDARREARKAPAAAPRETPQQRSARLDSLAAEVVAAQLDNRSSFDAADLEGNNGVAPHRSSDTASFEWRRGSNDAHAILEVFGCRALGRKPVYTDVPTGLGRLGASFGISTISTESSPDFSPDFSPRGHVVLDAGAHVGAFTRFALHHGALHVSAYEPEPSNAALLRRNTRGFAAAVAPAPAIVAVAGVAVRKDDEPRLFSGGDEPRLSGTATVAVCEAALVSDARMAGLLKPGGSSTVELVLGVDHRGVVNTWRHALADYSHYARPNNDNGGNDRNNDANTNSGGPSNSGGQQQKKKKKKKKQPSSPPLPSARVAAVAFGDALDAAAVAAGGKPVTFVKMDCEGAELEILNQVCVYSAQAAPPAPRRG